MMEKYRLRDKSRWAETLPVVLDVLRAAKSILFENLFIQFPAWKFFKWKYKKLSTSDDINANVVEPSVVALTKSSFNGS